MKPNQLRELIDRSIRRAHTVETPDHLPDHARDAYYLAVELKTLTERYEVSQRRLRAVDGALRSLGYQQRP